MIAVIFGLITSIIHFFSEEIGVWFRKFESELVSFSAGISITYLFLSLFPEFTYFASQRNRFLFLSVVIGFVVFHIVEKYIYQHAPEKKLLRELAVEDSTISFIYHFIVGMLMVGFFAKGFTQGMLFFIPVTLFTAVSTLPVDMTKFRFVKFLLALSTFLGVLFSTYVYVNINPLIYMSLLGFVIGALFFSVTRHSIPKGKDGKPLYFFLGFLLYSLLILLL